MDNWYTYWLERFASEGVDGIGEYKFGVNEWGSCQYAKALAAYRTYFAMRANLNSNDTLSIMGVKLSHGAQRSISYAKESILKEAHQCLTAVNNELAALLDAEVFDARACKSVVSEGLSIAKEMAAVAHVVSVDDLFRFLRGQSSDLWGASIEVCNFMFEDFDVSGTSSSPQYETTTGYMTGIRCAWLCDIGLVEEESSFADFDT